MTNFDYGATLRTFKESSFSLEIIRKARNHINKQFKENLTNTIIIGVTLFVSVLFRLLTLNSVDLVWDEGAWVMTTKRFADFFHIFLPFPFYLNLVLIMSICLILVELTGYLWKSKKFFIVPKEKLFRIIIISCLVFSFFWIIFSFLLDIGSSKLYHNPVHPSFYPILSSLLSLLTPFTSPELGAKLISVSAMVLLALTGYFLAKKAWDNTFGLITFLLLSFSPISIFYSQTAFHHPLATFLGYTSLCFFLYGLVDSNGLFFIPAALFFNLGFFTLYTIGALVPVMILAYLIFRGFADLNLNRYFFVWCSLIVLGISFNLNHLFSSFEYYYNYPATFLYPFDITKYSAFLINVLGGIPIVESATIYLELLLNYTGYVFLLFPLVIYFFFKDSGLEKRVLFSILVCFIGYLLYFSLLISWQADRHIVLLDFPVQICIAGVIKLFSNFTYSLSPRFEKFSLKPEIIGLVLILTIFLVQTSRISNESQFKGSSALAEYLFEKEASSIGTDSPVVTRYYLLQAGFQPSELEYYTLSYEGNDTPIFYGSSLRDILTQNASDPLCFCPQFLIFYRYLDLDNISREFIETRYDSVSFDPLEYKNITIASLYSLKL